LSPVSYILRLFIYKLQHTIFKFLLPNPNLLLEESTLPPDPLIQFEHWYKTAQKTPGILIPESVCLSTVGQDGKPDSRIVLLKDFSQKGFVFYTNYNSQKGKALLENPYTALTFYWEPLHAQVRIKGKAEKVTDSEADAYFKTRPRQSKLAAWASLQSEKLESRELLEKRFLEAERKFQEREITRPSHWSGFRVIPTHIEFWLNRDFRMHDRILYEKQSDGNWTFSRLYP